MADNSESESDFVVHVLRPALVYIRNADKYFIVPGEPCTPAPLETDDLVEFEKYCTALLNLSKCTTHVQNKKQDLKL
jgi:hypothetical protein